MTVSLDFELLDAAVIIRFCDQVEQPSSLQKVRVSVIYYYEWYDMYNLYRSSISKYVIKSTNYLTHWNQHFIT